MKKEQKPITKWSNIESRTKHQYTPVKNKRLRRGGRGTDKGRRRLQGGRECISSEDTKKKEGKQGPSQEKSERRRYLERGVSQHYSSQPGQEERPNANQKKTNLASSTRRAKGLPSVRDGAMRSGNKARWTVKQKDISEKAKADKLQHQPDEVQKPHPVYTIR